jgi:hypothetical protein
MLDVVSAATDSNAYTGSISSAQACFAGEQRVGYDAKALALVATQGVPLKIFLRREGDVVQAITFLPGFPGGSFGWAKFGRICRLRQRCRNSSSIMPAWAIAISPRTMPIPPRNVLISSKPSGAISVFSLQRWLPRSSLRASATPARARGTGRTSVPAGHMGPAAIA